MTSNPNSVCRIGCIHVFCLAAFLLLPLQIQDEFSLSESEDDGWDQGGNCSSIGNGVLWSSKL